MAHEVQVFIFAILVVTMLSILNKYAERSLQAAYQREREKALPEMHSYFADLLQVRDSPRIQAYLRASRAVYERRGMSIGDVHVSNDLSAAQF